ncbi:facilitated trehalose transporter Tret1-like [Belonocnema kinseyi]|uniref:facilitated trehalose transporter Tret1-like n=1 Tax=Belonocnema kinseyi TaxID=2817044 RepID=UPI00143CC216|nr:facilitated trehalose transporter Tret1-like [Belonocnema kinseyi]
MNTNILLTQKSSKENDEEINLRGEEEKLTDDKEVFQKRRIWSLQIGAAISASLLRLGFGAAQYWTSPALPHLKNENSEFPLTSDEASWVASLLSFGSVIGYLLYPQFIDRIGRKYTMLLFAIPQIISWILIFFAKNVSYLYIARFLGGLGYGASYVVQIIYVGEISDKNIRGMLIILAKTSFATGALITVTLGAFLSYEKMNLILLFMPLFFILTFSFMPESPYFYLKHSRDEDALKSLSKLRGIENKNLLELTIAEMKQDLVNNTVSKNHSLRKLFGKKRHRRAFLIALVAILGVIFSGAFTVVSFTQEIVSFCGFSLEPKYTTIIITSLVLISSILISPLPDYFGRKILILSYGLIGALSSAMVGLIFFLKFYHQVDISSISWIPLIALAINNIASTVGLYGMSVILSSELFPVEVKSSAVSLLYVANDSLLFLFKLGFQRSVDTFGIYGVFWIFAVLNFLLPLVTFSIMPETKGKTLEEVQKLIGR